MLEALVGHRAVAIGILVDQPGSFLVLSTLGIIVAAIFSGSKVTPQFIFNRVIFFPPFLALVCSLVWFIFNFYGTELLTPVFSKIAGTLVPLALFSVGFQLRFSFKVLRKRWIPLTLGLFFKLILLPMIFSFFYLKVLSGDALTNQVIILESAMASMITSAVVANEFNLDSEIANLMVGIGIPISLISVPLWNYFLFK